YVQLPRRSANSSRTSSLLTRTLHDALPIYCFPAIDYFEEARLPFIVAINGFDGYYPHAADEVRDALTLSPEIPIVQVDARDRASTKSTLITLVELAITLGHPGGAAGQQPTSTGGQNSWR